MEGDLRLCDALTIFMDDANVLRRIIRKVRITLKKPIEKS
jgi:hypothetical protein